MSEVQPELPSGWEWCALEDVAQVRLGRQRSPKNHTGPNMVPYLRAANVTWSGFDLSDVKEMQFSEDEVETYAVRPGDILVSEASGSASHVGKPAVWRGELPVACFQNTLLRVRSDGPLPEYLLLVLREAALSGRFGRAALGVGINHLGRERLANWPIPLAPLEVQQAIVAAVDELLLTTAYGQDALRAGETLRKAMRDALLATAFVGKLARSDPGERFDTAALGARRLEAWQSLEPKRPYREAAAPIALGRTVPAHWSVVSLEQATDPHRVICYGILKPKVKSGGTIPYVEVKDLRTGQLDPDGLHKTTKQLHDEFKRSTLRSGDVLLAIRGSYDRAAIVPRSLDGANISRDVARLAPLPGVLPEYLFLYLSSPIAQRYLDERARGVAVKGVNIGHLREMPLPIPPPAEQRLIVDRVSAQLAAVDELGGALTQASAQGRGLVRSVLDAAIGGRMATAESLGEPGEGAAGLLARIRTARAAQGPKRKSAHKRRAVASAG